MVETLFTKKRESLEKEISLKKEEIARLELKVELLKELEEETKEETVVEEEPNDNVNTLEVCGTPTDELL